MYKRILASIAILAALCLPIGVRAQSTLVTPAQSALGQVLPPLCDTTASVSISSATTTQLVAAAGPRKIYICSLFLVATGTNVTLQFKYGQTVTTACDTSATNVTAATPWPNQLYGVSGSAPILFAPAQNAFCVSTGGTVTSVVGWIVYTTSAFPSQPY